MKEARINGIIRKMKEAKIVGIFPTPVYISPLDRKLTSLELKLVEKNKKIFTKNAGNTTSANNYILNEKPFKKLKKELELRVKDYFQKIILHLTSHNLGLIILKKINIIISMHILIQLYQECFILIVMNR